jgi:hypothetical protein
VSTILDVRLYSRLRALRRDSLLAWLGRARWYISPVSQNGRRWRAAWMVRRGCLDGRIGVYQTRTSSRRAEYPSARKAKIRSGEIDFE